MSMSIDCDYKVVNSNHLDQVVYSVSAISVIEDFKVFNTLPDGNNKVVTPNLALVLTRVVKCH